MSMTKKDYELIATSLNVTLSNARALRGTMLMSDAAADKYIAGIEITIKNLSLALTSTNPRFNIDLFRQASGLDCPHRNGAIDLDSGAWHCHQCGAYVYDD